jgi:hypothetical protein
MIATGDFAYHEEAWLLLPWLANGRLSPAEREKVEEHVRVCAACTEELAFQRLMCKALAEPDRVTYAPGPSFRKLLERIDATTPQKPREASKAAAPRSRAARSASIALWRPPGLAWAASFVLAIGLAGIASTVYRWSEPLYITHTDAARVTPNVLHIAFDRSLTIGEVEQLLRSDNARVVEGPGSTGIFGVTPVAIASDHANGPNASREMQVLSARLRADPRVRWVEPISLGENNEQAHSPRGP